MATAIGSSWTKLVEYKSTATYSVTYRLYAKYSASSIANNTHTIQLKWTTQKTSGGTGVYDNDSTTPSVTNISNGNPTSWTGTAFTIPSGSAVAETDRTTSGNITVTHNSNGTYSATWSWSLSHVYEGGSKSGTVAVTLPTIPRASSFTLSDSNIYTNQTTTATITRADSSFTHNITTTYSGTSYTLASGVGTSASLSIPTGIRTAMKSANAKSATLTLTLTTLSGSTTIGTTTTSLTVTVPTATVTVTPASVACNSATTKWTLGNVDTTACTYTVQRLYGSTVRYTDETKSTTTTKSSLANALFEANITSATSGTVTVKVTTYVGTTTVGSNTVTYTVTIPTGTYKPSITFGSATRTGSTYGSIAYLAGYNGAKATFTTSVNGSSAIDSRSVIITNNITSTSLSYSGNTITVTTGTFPSNSSNYSVTITVTVRDKRGTSASASTTLTISGYAKPSVTATATRANSGGTADTEGTYANLTATGRAHTNASIASMQIKYGSTSVKTATSATVTQNAYGGSFAVANSYTFTAIATDNLGFSTTISFVLASASYVLSLHPSGGVGMGMVASADRVDIAYKQVNNSYGSGGEISLSNNNYRTGLHIGTGGANRGLYDFAGTSGSNSWVIYKNASNETVINSNSGTRIIFSGEASAEGVLAIENANASTNISFKPGVLNNRVTGGLIYYTGANESDLFNYSRFSFRQYSPNNPATNERGAHYEQYYLPVTTENLGSNKSYRILTNKEVVTEEQGGTGQSSLDDVTVGASKKVFNSLANPTSTTTFALPFLANNAQTIENAYTVRTNDGTKVQALQGTASAVGEANLIMGNSTPSGTAGNKRGSLLLFADTAYRVKLYAETGTSANRTQYLPDINGTLAVRDALVSGTLTQGSWVNLTYPTGYTKDNCHVSGWDVDYNGNHRTGDGLESSASASRVMVSLEASNIKVYTNSATYNGKTIRVFLSLNA